MRPGELIAGRYQLDEQVGAGGMGVVWRATDRELDRVVAMKRAHVVPDGADRGGQLRHEARVAAGFQHPNIVTVFDTVGDGPERWLVMEYVPSRSLAEILKDRQALPERQVAHLGDQIASALAAVHAEGVVHGDVKPGNVLVTNSGVAKLTDFGISRTVWGEVTLTSTGPAHGTPAYLAPEVIDGQRPTAASDVFSLGATLFAAVEGNPPYGSADNTLTSLRRAALDQREPFRRAGKLVPLLTTLLAKEPGDRPAAGLCQRLLHELANDHDTGSLPAPAPVTARRRKWLVQGAAGVVVVAAAAALLVTAPWSNSASGSASATAITSPRQVEPCALADPAGLSKYGETDEDPTYGNFDRCDVLLDNGGASVDVETQFQNASEPAPPLPGSVSQIGAVKVMRGTLNDGECLRTILLADQNSIVVSADQMSDSGHPALCAMAETATQAAVAVINKSGVPMRTDALDPKSLITVDACDLLDPQALTAVPGVIPSQREAGYADWDCRWSSNTSDTTVDLRFDRNQPLDSEDGTPIQFGDRSAFVEPDGDGDGSCVVQVVHRTFKTADDGPISEIMMVTVDGKQPQSQLCGTATDLAGSAAAKLPQV